MQFLLDSAKNQLWKLYQTHHKLHSLHNLADGTVWNKFKVRGRENYGKEEKKLYQTHHKIRSLHNLADGTV